MDRYLPRIIDTILVERLSTIGAILIEGPKWCGKTMTASEVSKSQLFMQDPDNLVSYLKAADTKPSLLLKGDKPRLLDEWQMAPVLWDAVRFNVDQTGLTNQYILTGSAVPRDNAVMHSGTGRIGRLMMRPMSLYESLESSGAISLGSLFNGETDVEAVADLSIEEIAVAIVRGGWPAAVTDDDNEILRYAIDYTDAVVNRDIVLVDDVKKDPAKVRTVMRSLARNISTLANIKTITEDVAGADGDTISSKTVSYYINTLRRIFVVEDLPAWSPIIRSKTAIRTSVKRQFVDPSIATAILRLSPAKILEDFEYFGFLFESLCIRDLRIYAEAIDGEVFHYRDKSGLEADAIIALADGRWGAIEIKLGSKEIEKAANNLIKLANKINTKKMKEPSFLMVLTGGQYAYKRDDGVLIVPISCLKK